MSDLIVIQNGNSTVNKRWDKGNYYTISYTLVKDLEYKEEEYFARLVSVSGAKEVVLVFADFVRRQHVNGELEPYLGSSATTGRNSWVPLANNVIPSFGLLHLRKANLTSLPAKKIKNTSDSETPGYTLALVIEIAPKSWINGA